MDLSYRARRRWSLIILLIGLPVYIVVAVNIVDLFDRPPIWAEVTIFVVLGFLWMLPFRFVFRGIGRPDPDAEGPGARAGAAPDGDARDADRG